jgi:hypothetical protein
LGEFFVDLPAVVMGFHLQGRVFLGGMETHQVNVHGPQGRLSLQQGRAGFQGLGLAGLLGP